MKYSWTSLLLSSGLATLAIVPTVNAADAPATASPNYHLLKEITVGGGTSWDYLSVDSDAHRLYVSHGTEVVVIDTAKDAVVGNISDTPGVHGIAIAPKLNRVFVSNGRGNNVSVVDAASLKTLQKVDTGTNPDAILYEPTQNEVYAFNGRGNSATVFAADTGNLVATIPLNGKPEFAQTDSGIGKIFDNLEDKNAVAVIDAKTHALTATWPIAPGEGASGMAIDTANKRLFLGCTKIMAMLDYTSGKIITSVPIPDGVDACSYDPVTKLAFSSCGAPTTGTVIIAHEDSPDKLSIVQTLTTMQRAKTMTIDPATHKIYLGTVKPDTKAAAPAPGTRGPASGTFTILVYGMDNPPAAK